MMSKKAVVDMLEKQMELLFEDFKARRGDMMATSEEMRNVAWILSEYYAQDAKPCQMCRRFKVKR